jgi:hypothetical protein
VRVSPRVDVRRRGASGALDDEALEPDVCGAATDLQRVVVAVAGPGPEDRCFPGVVPDRDRRGCASRPRHDEVLAVRARSDVGDLARAERVERLLDGPPRGARGSRVRIGARGRDVKGLSIGDGQARREQPPVPGWGRRRWWWRWWRRWRRWRLRRRRWRRWRWRRRRRWWLRWRWRRLRRRRRLRWIRGSAKRHELADRAWASSRCRGGHVSGRARTPLDIRGAFPVDTPAMTRPAGVEQLAHRPGRPDRPARRNTKKPTTRSPPVVVVTDGATKDVFAGVKAPL